MSNPTLPVPLVTEIEAPIPAGVSAALIYEGDNPLLPQILDEVEARARGELDGVTAETAAGRKLLKSVPYRVTRAKVALDDLGKEFVADLRAKVKSVDERRRDARTKLDALKLELRDPLTRWDAEQARIAEEKARKERERLAGIDGALDALRSLGEPDGRSAEAVSRAISALEREVPEEVVFQERLPEAMSLRDDLLRGLHKDLQIETLREEADARAKKEREEAARRAAEEAERELRRRAEVEHQLAEERAKAQAEREAREAAERERAEMARQLEEAQAEARRIKEEAEKPEEVTEIIAEADHPEDSLDVVSDFEATVNELPESTPEFEAATSLVVLADLDMPAAERVITAIVAGEIPHVEWEL
jgi:hypothetical protein